MPPTAATLRVGRYFLTLLIVLVALFGLVFLPGQRHTPKLGLDLVGGAQVILKASTDAGKQPSTSSMKVAREILRQRVNGAGVTGAEVVQEGSDRISISVPGKSANELAQIGKAAVLNFRPLVMPGVIGSTPVVPSTGTNGSAGSTGSSTPGTTTPATSGPGPSTTATSTPQSSATTKKAKASPSPSSNGIIEPQGLAAPLAAAKTTPAATKTATKSTGTKSTATKTTAATPSPSATPTAATVAETKDPFTKLGFALPTSEAAFDALTPTRQQQLSAALENFKCGSKPTDTPTAVLAGCGVGGAPKYLLGPVIVAGKEISSAAAVAPSSNNFGWSISIDLKSAGQARWATYTNEHHSTDSTADPTTCSPTTTPCAEFVAFTLDGDVISAPHNEATINGTTSVTGQYTQTSAQQLANQLKYGALPLSFDTLTTQDVTATLGTSQLKAGLLAGGIGLALVVLYSLLYYRGLGLVTIASLLVSGALTYACLVILGREIGFTLNLAGIAGFIVAVGITADSFVVFFERLKDEVHSGRSIRVAVPRAWTRARRTILSADTVSFLAAAVLYYFAAGDVRGFAFTLGLSTILDLVVVFLFTHPIVSLLSHSRAFGSPRFTGLNSVRPPGSPVPSGAAGTAGAVGAVGWTAPARPRRGHGAVAALDRESDVDLDLGADRDAHDIEPFVDASAPAANLRPTGLGRPHDEVGPDQAGADTGFAEPEAAVDSGAPRARRVSHRPAAGALIGQDAAERAAQRRGRVVRPPAPVEVEAVDDEPRAADEPTDDHPAVTEVEPASSAAAVPAVPAVPEVAAGRGGATAMTVDTPVQPADGPIEDPGPEVRPQVAASPVTTPPVITAAAGRAAARRERVRSRAGTQVETDAALTDSGTGDAGAQDEDGS